MPAPTGQDPAQLPGPSCAEGVGPGLRGQCVCKEEAPSARGSAGRQGAAGRGRAGAGKASQSWVLLGSPCGLRGPDRGLRASVGSRSLCLKCDQGPV